MSVKAKSLVEEALSSGASLGLLVSVNASNIDYESLKEIEDNEILGVFLNRMALNYLSDDALEEFWQRLEAGTLPRNSVEEELKRRKKKKN